MSTAAGDRFYERLQPLAFDDEAQGFVLRGLARALAAPREVFEVARADDDHAIPWGRLLDPDSCPDELLDWLGCFAGTVFPPSAIAAAEKRYRIKQAAGMYRGTPRAVIEELQLVLTGTKTVYIGFHTPDQWHYAVGTLVSETPDPDAVARAVLAQKPAGMVVDIFTTSDWSYLFVGPTVVGHRATVDGADSFVLGGATYPTYQAVVDHFTTYTALRDDTPH